MAARKELRGAALAALRLDQCSVCTRGREACAYCEHVDERDWEAMCDCGLRDFGRHIVSCDDRMQYKYVIALDPASALIPRAE